jgi:2-oxoglutarate ferredoxin oxidoreductase subunit gamma
MLKLVFTGVGGQGIITAGILLAEAAVIEEGRHATQSQSYGAEARGGLTRTDIIIDQEMIHYPKIEECHVLAALHQRGYDAYASVIRPGGRLIADENSVTIGPKADARRYLLPILTECETATGGSRGANMTLLGVVIALTGVVAADSVRAVLQRRYGKNADNEKAFDAGLALGGPVAVGAL